MLSGLFPDEIILAIVQWLSPRDSAKLLRINTNWYILLIGSVWGKCGCGPESPPVSALAEVTRTRRPMYSECVEELCFSDLIEDPELKPHESGIHESFALGDFKSLRQLQWADTDDEGQLSNQGRWLCHYFAPALQELWIESKTGCLSPDVFKSLSVSSIALDTPEQAADANASKELHSHEQIEYRCGLPVVAREYRSRIR